ncbi:hypothetical protein Acy02nite_48010 [Actinoplanes cyaneus]|uniref:Pyrrolo-quinoline quinone repeat domain-containing protein n=1 Tax=Actinoplanes cyaneus TaxID=52696 RepID=A0A919M266_9ACTN|nr:PQQ-binding-like beta-propeller repeat protein [Actinoplanes cyaneus]MCW2138755.1 outer membrane protein assembly factor BamB [Actinoplanes cyaneus]GID66920.1 hypothetical protein Acy02nite_48010 [Actinoplanes cyaneus]
MVKVGVIALILATGLGSAPAPASWGQDGYGPGNTRYNPAESVINAGSVARLRLRWTVEPAPDRPGCESVQVAPRAVDDRVVLLEGGGVAARSATTGKRLWINTGFGRVTAGPVVTGGLVLVAGTSCESNSDYDGSLVALDVRTGAQRWRRTGEWTIDAVVADAGVIVTSGYCRTCEAGHGVNTYRLNDGTPLWTHREEELAGQVSAGGTILLRRTAGDAETWAGRIGTGTTIWGNDLGPVAVAANPDGTQFYLRDSTGLCARAAADGRQLWQAPKEAGDLAADGRRVYVASAGRVNTYDAGTGRLLWTRAVDSPREPVRAGGLLYVLSGKGNLVLLSPVDGRPVGSKVTFTGLTTHVVPAGGRLLTTHRRAVRSYAP